MTLRVERMKLSGQIWARVCIVQQRETWQSATEIAVIVVGFFAALLSSSDEMPS